MNVSIGILSQLCSIKTSSSSFIPEPQALLEGYHDDSQTSIIHLPYLIQLYLPRSKTFARLATHCNHSTSPLPNQYPPRSFLPTLPPPDRYSHPSSLARPPPISSTRPLLHPPLPLRHHNPPISVRPSTTRSAIPLTTRDLSPNPISKHFPSYLPLSRIPSQSFTTSKINPYRLAEPTTSTLLIHIHSLPRPPTSVDSHLAGTYR